MMKNAVLLQNQVAKNLGLYPQDIEIGTAIKNNGVEKTVVCIKGLSGKNASPVIYIDDLLSRWNPNDEKNIRDIAYAISMRAKKLRSDKTILPVIQLDEETILSHCFLQVIGTEKNEPRLAQMPHFRFADLAAVVRVEIDIHDKDAFSSTVVTHDMARHYKLDLNKLFETAKRNTASKSHFECFPLDAIMENLCFGAEITPVMNMGPGLYCLTNRYKMNGAAILAIPELMHQILQNASGSAYIIPSSIHEVLVFVGEMNVSDLRQMVCDVNATQVPPEDIMSDNVYVFDQETLQLKIAE